MSRSCAGATGHPGCHVLPSAVAVTVETLAAKGGSGDGDAIDGVAISNELVSTTRLDTTRIDHR